MEGSNENNNFDEMIDAESIFIYKVKINFIMILS
jgi:hypothetical protein